MIARKLEKELQCDHDAHVGMAITAFFQKSTFTKTNLRKPCLKMSRALLRLSAFTNATLIFGKALTLGDMESRTMRLCR